jgi:pimeloyl-ACP methyl ester carboxylesterase
MKKTLLSLIAVPTILYSLAMVGLYTYQEKLIFPAAKLPSDHRFQFTVPFKEINIPVSGATLNALHFAQEKPRGLVFFLHGNAGNLETWTTGIDFYKRENYDLFIFDYRGYGKSTGKIDSQQQLHDDVRTAWDYISPQFSNKPIVIYGRSLGSALATQLAIDTQPEQLLLVSPFSSMKTLAQQLYPFAPSFLLRYPLETDKIISQVTADVFYIHGDNDTFIPIQHSKTLQTTKPGELLVISGADHSDIHLYETYLNALAEILPDRKTRVLSTH